MRRSTRMPGCLLAVLLLLLPIGRASALPPDGWRLGVQLLGTGLASVLVEYHFTDNAICLSVGIFDAFDEPDVALWYRRYVRFSALEPCNLVPYAGAGVAGIANIHQLSGAIFMAGAAAGIDWNFCSTLSLCVEGDILLGIWPGPAQVGGSPALSLRAGF